MAKVESGVGSCAKNTQQTNEQKHQTLTVAAVIYLLKITNANSSVIGLMYNCVLVFLLVIDILEVFSVQMLFIELIYI